MKVFLLLLAGVVWGGEITPRNARVEAVVEKTGLMSGKRHVIVWERFRGSYQEEAGTVEVEVEAGSAKVLDDWIGDGKREEVRKETVGKNVLDAERHGQIRFRGKRGADGRVAGTLNVRGVAREVALTVRKTAEGWEGETRFLMSWFGIKPPRAALGAVGTKDEMVIRVRVGGSQ